MANRHAASAPMNEPRVALRKSAQCLKQLGHVAEHFLGSWLTIQNVAGHLP